MPDCVHHLGLCPPRTASRKKGGTEILWDASCSAYARKEPNRGRSPKGLSDSAGIPSNRDVPEGQSNFPSIHMNMLPQERVMGAQRRFKISRALRTWALNHGPHCRSWCSLSALHPTIFEHRRESARPHPAPHLPNRLHPRRT